MEFAFRRYWRRQHEYPFLEQFAGFNRSRDTADIACRRFVVMDAPRLFGKTLADIFGLARHRKQSHVQFFHGGRADRRRRLFRYDDIRCPAPDMGRRRQLPYRRRLTLGTMHEVMLALAVKGLARSKPAFEAVSVVAEQIQDYHLIPLLEFHDRGLRP